MKKKIISTFAFITAFSLVMIGQTVGDALRYSNWQTYGSARYVGTGGAMGALGGDYSTIISNPAGLATFRRPEITFTPYFGNLSTSSSFAGNESRAKAQKIGVGQVAAVFTSTSPEKWKSVNFSIGYNQLADFRKKVFFTGTNNGSIANYFLSLAQGLNNNQLGSFDAGLAADSDLIYRPDATNNPTFWENDIKSTDQTLKFQNINQRGSMGELNLSLAGNYEHKFYLGLGLNIPFVSFSETKIYEEKDENETIKNYNFLKYTEKLSTNGAGVNLKIGAIYRPTQAVRIGLAFHSPSWLTLTDNYSSAMDFNITYNKGQQNESTRTNTSTSPNGQFEYIQQTPMRLVGNVAFLIKKRGFLSAEVEWLDYGMNQFNYDPNGQASSADLQAEQEINNSIENLLQSSLNVKFGGEVSFAKNFRVRAGYALYGDPFLKNSNKFNTQQMSFGLGFREDNYFVDATFVRKTSSEDYIPYRTTDNTPFVKNNFTNQYFILTLGFKLSNDNLSL